MVGLMKATSKEELIKFSVYSAELTERALKEEARLTGKPPGKALLIQNLDGVSGRQIRSEAMAILKQVVGVVTENYPERLGIVYFVNLPTPRLFAVGWSIVKLIFDENLRSKFNFLTSADWKEKLLEHIEPEHLPAYLGGTLRVPDDDCSDILGVGGVVPENLYRTNDDSFSSITIPAGKSHKIQATVNSPGSIISWEFSTKEHDIKFGAFFLGREGAAAAEGEAAKQGQKVDVLEASRIPDSYREVISGELIAEQAGVYVLEWDNGYSYLRSKTLLYKYEVSEPTSQEPRRT